jgi:stage II sporulation protein D
MTGSLTTPQRISGRTAAAALATALAVLAVALALGVAPAGATPAGTNTTTSMVMEGRGWGHGIGMSQYGADGYALHGWQYAAIIEHYYTGVTLGKVGNVPIRVQLRSGVASAAVTDAGRFSVTWGTKTVHPLAAGTTVTFVPRKSRLKLLTANDNGYVGRYRGRLRLVHFTDGLMIINALSLETYLYGVVPRESPASWPIEALKAQAVAARSYAYRATGGSGAFDVYCTTASQMYGGADGETAATNLAVNSTKGIVPEYQGTPIVAYFFSTSGGHTENIENVWTGVAPVPYLKGVPDPYDTTSPYHTWPNNPIRRTPAQIAAAMGFAKGPLRAVYVVKRGTSPRVVKALLIGDKGWAVTNGASLRADLGLRDAWVYFTSLSIARSATTVTYGQAVTLSGRRYPQLAATRTVALHSRLIGGPWSSHGAAAKAGSSTVDGYVVRFTGFSAKVVPTGTTQYYFSTPAAMGAYALSTHVTVDVRPAVTIKAPSGTITAGDGVVLTGTITPAAAAETVVLQTLTSSGWKKLTSATPAPDGSYSFTWTAVAGSTTLRAVALPATTRFVPGASLPVTLTVASS